MSSVPLYLRDSYYGVPGGTNLVATFINVPKGVPGPNAEWVELPSGLFLHRDDWSLLPANIAAT